MKRGESVSIEQLQSAFKDVQRSLSAVGLWYDGCPLSHTEVIWCHPPPEDVRDAAGFFIHEHHRLYHVNGYQCGNIYVPKRIMTQGLKQNRGSLRDVLRHEFGHAMAYHYPGAIRRSRAFATAFGARYDEVWVIPPTNAEDFVTEYAMSCPMEDFAETFACWLRNPADPWSGLPRIRANPDVRPTPALRGKFRFIARVCRRLAK